MMSHQESSPISFLGLFIWGIAAFFFLYEFFLRTFIGSLAHQVIPDLHLNPETFAIIGSAYYIAYGMMQVPVGILTDKFGVKLNMLFAISVCVLAVFIFSQANNFAVAFLSRAMMGFGSAFAFVCLLVIVSNWLPSANFGFFAGISQFIGTMGPLLAGGPLVAVMAKTHQSWRVTLSEVGFIGILLALLVLLFVRDKPKNTASSMIKLQRQESIMTQLRRLLSNKQAWFVVAYSAGVYVSMALMGAIWGTEYLQVVGFSQKHAAGIVSLAWFGYAMGCPLMGAMSDIAKRRRPSLYCCALLGAVVTCVINYVPLHHSLWAYSILFFGLGFAASGQNVAFAIITEHSDPREKATALGLNNASMTLASAILPPLVSYMIVQSQQDHTAPLQLTNFTAAFSIMPIVFFGASVISLFFISETYCKPQKEPTTLVV